MAKKKHAKPHEEENGEAWLLPYSDLMTLLLALFIALFAISQTDQKKMSELAQAFTAAFNMGGPSFFDKAGPNVGRRAETPSDEDLGNSAYFAENKQLEEIQKKMQEYIEENHLEDQLSTEMAEEGLMIRIKERALFPSGSAQLVGQAQSIVPVVAGMLASLPERVVISGHTDNVPMNTAKYADNRELSTGRARSVYEFITSEEHFIDENIKIAGYGESRPIASNATAEGRARNRRVCIKIYNEQNSNN